jgi:type VI secretion system secreted protein VgrG
VIIKCGNASITLHKDGTVAIRGHDFVVETTGDATLKAAKSIVLKGQKILES